MRVAISFFMRLAPFSLLAAMVSMATAGLAAAQQKVNIYQTTLQEANQATPEITTEELRKILASGSEPVFDVRSAKEYAIGHIPGSINLYEKEVEQIVQLYPDKEAHIVLYCNGPFCGKSKRTAEHLAKLGYRNIKRYQLGIPVWRALGNTVQTDLEGVRYVLMGDKTAVFVDARTEAEFEARSVPGAVNIHAGEAEQANEDGRLPLKDKGSRVIVFGNTAQDARIVAEQIGKKAYWNSSYFGGSYQELDRAGLWK
ncbi:MAG: rhodanese-like domain-containing protein [Bacteroidota bacterium]